MSIDTEHTGVRAEKRFEEMSRIGKSSLYNYFYPKKMKVINDLVRRIRDEKNKREKYSRVTVSESEMEVLKSYRFFDPLIVGCATYLVTVHSLVWGVKVWAHQGLDFAISVSVTLTVCTLFVAVGLGGRDPVDWVDRYNEVFPEAYKDMALQKITQTSILPGPSNSSLGPVDIIGAYLPEKADPHLTRAWKIVDAVRSRGDAKWWRFFYPEQAQVARDWADRAKSDLFNASVRRRELTDGEREILGRFQYCFWGMRFMCFLPVVLSVPSRFFLEKLPAVSRLSDWDIDGIWLAVFFVSLLIAFVALLGVTYHGEVNTVIERVDAYNSFPSQPNGQTFT